MRISRIVAIALIVFVAFEAGVRFVAPTLPDAAAWPTPEAELKSRQIEALSTKPHIVFVGTSVSEAAIDPDLVDRLLGTRSYNAALPFSTPLSTREWVEGEVLPELAPDVLVIGVLDATIAIGEDLLVGPLKDSLSYDPQAAWWQRSILLARREQLRHPEQTLERIRIISSGLWTTAGHQTAYYERSLNPSGDAEPLGAGIVDERMLSAITSTIERARSAGAVPVLLLEPGGCPPIYRPCAEAVAVRDRVAAIAAEQRVGLIDGRSIEWPSSYYADPSHFNQEGTRAFSRFVAEELRRIDESEGHILDRVTG